MHIDEDKIELFAYYPASLDKEETVIIIEHLKKCHICKDIYDAHKSMLNALSDENNKQPDINDIDFVNRLNFEYHNTAKHKSLLEHNNVIQIYNGNIEIIKKHDILSLTGILSLIKNYPVPTFSVFTIAVLAIALFFVQIKNTLKDTNPVSFNIENSILTMYNKSAEVLWKKNVFGIPNLRIDSLTTLNYYNSKKYILFSDIDGDGKNEIILSGGINMKNSALFSSDSLYCFNYDGSKRWVASAESKKYNYTPFWNRTRWNIIDFFTVKTKKEKKLFLIAHDNYYGGSLISEIDIKTGEVSASLYHSGWITADNHFDLNDSGVELIFLGGTSCYDKPFFMILDPQNLYGVMPDKYSRYTLPKGSAIYYVLLKATNLGRFLSHTTSFDVQEIQKLNYNSFFILTNEFLDPRPKLNGGVLYKFNREISILTAAPDVNFSMISEQQRKKGLFKEITDSLYFNSLKDSIQYWDGDKFVNHPVKNKYYNLKQPSF